MQDFIKYFGAKMVFSHARFSLCNGAILENHRFILRVKGNYCI